MVAILQGGPLAVEMGDTVPDCHACYGEENAPNRELWGCDAPRTDGVGVWRIACECGGIEQDCKRADCESGWRPLYRCPRALMREAPADVAGFFSVYGHLREHGVLPCRGGMLDQPVTFVQACQVAGSESAAWDRERDEWMSLQRAKAKGAKGGG